MHKIMSKTVPHLAKSRAASSTHVHDGVCKCLILQCRCKHCIPKLHIFSPRTLEIRYADFHDIK